MDETLNQFIRPTLIGLVLTAMLWGVLFLIDAWLTPHNAVNPQPWGFLLGSNGIYYYSLIGALTGLIFFSPLFGLTKIFLDVD